MVTSGDAGDFEGFFSDAMESRSPYAWQTCVAVEGIPGMLPIPTGLGKTEGVVLAWAWRLLRADANEPAHLVYCLPMRTLVRQTVDRLDRCFARLTAKRGSPRIPVYQLMGGAIDEEWAGRPETPWVLVGTQDQLLSRALNRGYAMSRFEWPVHFGLLNVDCRWIVDEVQLMGPGLWTTAQLDWMRLKRFPVLKPCRTTWMSATLGQGFLATTDRKKDKLDKVEAFNPHLDEDDHEELKRRRSAQRSVEWLDLSTGKRAATISRQIASAATAAHSAGTLTLIICNTVQRAQEVFQALPNQPPKILLTSRFRRQDRLNHEAQLLDFEERRCKTHSGRVDGHSGTVCVSTQVVEAGLDISAARLWSELAPWPSVIQRLGRLNRDGRDNRRAAAYFWQTPKCEEHKRDGEICVGPYRKRDLDSAKELLNAVAPVSAGVPFTSAMEKLEETHPDLVARALQPEPAPLPRALDVHGLFSTERDVHGGFTDVSAFVRSSDPDADLAVFWRDWPGTKPPQGDALDGPPLDVDAEGCPVAAYHVSEFLKAHGRTAWIWNDEDDKWETCAARDLRPGMVVMLHRDFGGYDVRVGWTGDPVDKLREVQKAGRGRALCSDERTETGSWVAQDVHLTDARREAERMCYDLGLRGPLRTAVVEAAGLHDLGKAHPKWQTALPAGSVIQGGPWAKCPRVLGVDVSSADSDICKVVARLRPSALALPTVPKRGGGFRFRWAVDVKLDRDELAQLIALRGVRWAGHVPFRPGMRHEAASALAMWKRYRHGQSSFPALAVYLVASHHGKVRTVLRTTTPDGEDVFGVPVDSEAVQANGQSWPLDFSVAGDGAAGNWHEQEFVLTDYGWTGLAADLLGPWQSYQEDRSNAGAVPEDEPRRLGPFNLAWLEALVRVADWRASDHPSRSVTLSEVSCGD